VVAAAGARWRPSSRGLRAAGGFVLLAMPLLQGCHSMSEGEALEAARQEVREEMRPEIEKRQKEIEELKRQITAARARLAERKTAAESSKR
jgi:hypothetical protein